MRSTEKENCKMRSKRKYVVSMGILMLFFATRMAYSQNYSYKFAPDVKLNGQGATQQYIVTFNHAPTASYHNKVLSRGGKLNRELRAVRGGVYNIPVNQLASLASDPTVVHISPDRPVKVMLDNTTAAVNAAVAWQSNLDGSGIGVAVIDSGISDHPDLEPMVSRGSFTVRTLPVTARKITTATASTLPALSAATEPARRALVASALCAASLPTST
jgi:hypothetical protein